MRMFPRKRSGIGGLVLALSVLSLWIVTIVGWCMNFQNLFQYPVGSQEFVVSLVGVFVPILGAFTGFYW